MPIPARTQKTGTKYNIKKVFRNEKRSINSSKLKEKLIKETHDYKLQIYMFSLCLV